MLITPRKKAGIDPVAVMTPGYGAPRPSPTVPDDTILRARDADAKTPQPAPPTDQQAIPPASPNAPLSAPGAPPVAGVLVRPRGQVVPDDGTDPLPEEAKLDAIKSEHVHNHNNRIVGALLSGLALAGRDANEHPARDWQGLMHNVGEGLGGVGYGLAKTDLDEQIGHDLRQDKAQRDLETAQKNQAAGTLIKSRNAATQYQLARPELERAKAGAAAAARAQSLIGREIANRLKEPRAFDPTDTYDADLLQRARAAGVSFDTQGFGDFKNPVSLEVEDPTDPNHVRKTRMQYNRDSGQFEPLEVNGQPVVTRRVQPVLDNGMTPNQEHVDADRDVSRANIERQRGIQNEFTRLRIRQGDQRISLSEASQDDRLSERTRRELKEANKLSADSERYQQAANDLSTKTTYRDPETGEERESKKWAAKRDEYHARAAALRQQLVANYGYLFSPSDDGVPEMSTDTFSRLFPALGGNYTGESQRLGVRLTDAGGGQNPVSPSVLPRRGAPARTRAAATAPQGGAKFDEATVRARATATGKDPEAAVRAARAKGLIK
jgi:hypothetical protein